MEWPSSTESADVGRMTTAFEDRSVAASFPETWLCGCTATGDGGESVLPIEMVGDTTSYL